MLLVRELSHRHEDDLPHPLATDVESFADLLEGQRPFAVDPESQRDDFPLPVAERRVAVQSQVLLAETGRPDVLPARSLH
jgi:hypothetical protein